MARFSVAVTLLVLGTAGALAANAQQPARTPRIGYLTSTSYLHPSFGWVFLGVSMPKIGYRHTDMGAPQNIVVLARSGGRRDELLPAAVAELVASKVDLIVAEGTPAVLAARRGSSTIPVIMAIGGDPVRAGLVASLSRPGGNVTGLTSMSREVVAKRLQLLKEVAPGTKRVGVLWNPLSPEKELEWEALQAVAPKLGVTLESLEIRGEGDIGTALEAAVRARAGGLLVLDDSLTLTYEELIVAAVNSKRLPAVYGFSRDPRMGALIVYGPSVFDLADMAATYVDKILRGAAKPADLPVQQPTRIELVVNLKAAQAIGLTVPPAIRFGADRVIE
jgi:putative tryptophan/tyrosine transport system substrate-binding protein